MLFNWGDGGKFLDGSSMSFLGVEDYAVLGNVVLVQVLDGDSVSDVVTVLLESVSLTVSVADPLTVTEFGRVAIPMVVLVVESAAAADVAMAALRLMIQAVEAAAGTDAVTLAMPLVLLVTDDAAVAELASVLLPIVVNIAETGLTPEEWVRQFIGIIAIVTSDVIPIGERRLALLHGFETLYFGRAHLAQTRMTDEVLVVQARAINGALVTVGHAPETVDI